MTLYIPLEWLAGAVALVVAVVVALGGYALVGLVLAVLVYSERNTQRPWRVSQWVGAIATAPLATLELLLEMWVRGRIARRRQG